MPDHEDQRVVVGWGLLLGWVILVIAMVVMVVAATFFATGLRDGFIETGGSAAGLGAMLVALVIGVSGLIVVSGVSASRTTRIVRPRLHLGLILAVPLVWMTITMAVSWQFVGAISRGVPTSGRTPGTTPGLIPGTGSPTRAAWSSCWVPAGCCRCSDLRFPT